MHVGSATTAVEVETASRFNDDEDEDAAVFSLKKTAIPVGMQKVVRATVDVLWCEGTKRGNSSVRFGGQEQAPVSGLGFVQVAERAGTKDVIVSTKAEMEETPAVGGEEHRPTTMWPLPHEYDDLLLLAA